MNNFNKIQIFIILAIAVLLSSCGEKSSEDSFDQIAGSDTISMVSNASNELVDQVIKSIPPPVEMSAIIKNSGAPYNNDILNSIDNKDKYTTNYLKAINLGIYGADMGYINIYDHKEDVLTYLNTVVGLAEDLKIGQFFDFKTIKRLATNSSNLDSMLNITTSNFEKMNTYLQENKRANLSMYMLTGGWVEALYIASSVAIKDHNQKLMEKIGEQKVVLDQLGLLLSFFKTDPNAIGLSKELEELKKVYSEIKIETIYAEPTMVEENGMLVVKDNSKTVIAVTEDQVKRINDITIIIRNKIIN